MTIRAALVEKGILPTPELAKNAYWRLKDQWWRQIIDGEFHKFGQYVFDEGLHYGQKEPGYLQGILEASQVFTNRIDEEFNLDLYRAVHHAACKHFKGNENHTLCTSEEIDCFRNKEGASFPRVQSQKCSRFEEDYESLEDKLVPLRSYAKIRDCPTGFFSPEQIKEAYEAAKKHSQALVKEDPSLENLSEEEIINLLEEKRLRLKEDIKKHALEVQNWIDCYFKSVKERLSLFAPLTKTEMLVGGRRIHFTYTVPTEKMEFVVNAFIRDYNQGLAKAQQNAYDKLFSGMELSAIKTEYRIAARREIARFYADLEWAHPWIDGQGRTDLIAALNGQLCREGLHPCILEDPYYSTSSVIEDWDAYLAEGLKKYEELCQELKVNYDN